MAPAVAAYEPRDPSRTVLYSVIAEHFETFLAWLDDDPDAKGLPAYVQREFYHLIQAEPDVIKLLSLNPRACTRCPYGEKLSRT